MQRKPQPIRSDIAWSTRDRIVVRGRDLPGEILGRMSLAQFTFLQLTGRVPSEQQARVLDAILIVLVEHGLTPSALAARLTYTGAPESLQAAVAAGLCGLGSVFVGSMEGAAKLLQEALPDALAKADPKAIACNVVRDFHARGDILPGFGHPIHKPIDPRTPRLFDIAAENGLTGPYIPLIKLIASEAAKTYGKPMPINATGAIGAMCCELGFPWQIVRGFGVMARAIGLVGHILEESRMPIARELWLRTDDEASAHMRQD